MTYVVAYIVMALIFGRIVARNEYRASLANSKYRESAETDALWAFLMGGVFWPISAFVYTLIGIRKAFTANLMRRKFGTLLSVAARLAVGKPVSRQRKEAELEKRRARVLELEKELGL